MTREAKIVSALREQMHRPDVRERDLHKLGESAYRLCSHPSWFLKWMAEDDARGANEIAVNRTLLQDGTIDVPQWIGVATLPDGKIACWEWLDGVDLRDRRERLPEAFAQIGRFHRRHRHRGTVFSLIDHRAYPSVEALLEGEADLLCRQYNEAACGRIRAIFARLRIGYSTIIHGDFHPGNLRLADGRLKVVDWGFCASSLNLFELGYVEAMEPCRQEWWRIRCEEAEAVLATYYRAAGLEGVDFRAVHRAVMLWAELWAYANGHERGLVEETEASRQRIERLLAQA